VSIPVRFHASVLSLATDDEAYVRFGFVPAQARVYGIDPAFGDLDLYLATSNGLVVPVAISRTAALHPPTGPTVIDGEIWAVPVTLGTPDGTTRHISQAVILATGFSDHSPVPSWVHFNAVMGHPSLPRTHLLRLEDQPSPVLLYTTKRPPKVGTPVAIKAHLSCYEMITEHGTFSVLCLRGTAKPLKTPSSTSDSPNDHGNHSETPSDLAAPSMDTETNNLEPQIAPSEDMALDDNSAWLTALLAIPGVGPYVATTILTTIGASSLAKVIADGDTTTLAQVPGVGPKTAVRIINEIVCPTVSTPSGTAEEKLENNPSFDGTVPDEEMSGTIQKNEDIPPFITKETQEEDVFADRPESENQEEIEEDLSAVINESNPSESTNPNDKSEQPMDADGDSLQVQQQPAYEST
jgi:DNA uptake protein ComE-like DNA-binding protein